ncbi:MAG: class I SAM-dependent methyltransferase [Acidobacteria bacterium]|nr:MAG: class I SAM-dependent methyltransferase [Acidobacteriota bacterium]
MFREAGPEFYNEHYYRSQCGGHEQFDAFDGWHLDPIRRRALTLARIGPGQRILDIGCGRGEMVLTCALRGAQAVGVDFSPHAVRLARELLDKFNVRAATAIVQMDAADLGFTPNQFDRILMLDLVEHISEERLRRLIGQCHRLLKPGGRVVIHTGPTREFIRYGQRVKRLIARLRRQPVPAMVTWEGEARLAGHCNLHSRESLLNLLAVFEKRWAGYEFTVDGGWAKRLARACRLTRYLAFNLWAVGVKAGGSHDAGEKWLAGDRDGRSPAHRVD